MFHFCLLVGDLFYPYLPYFDAFTLKQRIEYRGADAFQIDVSVVIEHSQYPSSHVMASFIGKELWAYGAISGVQTISVTPSVVRSIVEYAIHKTWRPQYDMRSFLIKNAEQIFPQAILSEIEDGWDDYIQTLREYYQNYTEPISPDSM